MKSMQVKRGQSHRIHGYRHVGGVRLCDVEPRCNRPWPCYDHGTRMVVGVVRDDVIDAEFEDARPVRFEPRPSAATPAASNVAGPPAQPFLPSELPPFWVATRYTGIYSASDSVADRGVARRSDCWAWRVPGRMYTACQRPKATLLEALLASYGFETEDGGEVYWLGGQCVADTPRVYCHEGHWYGRPNEGVPVEVATHWWYAVEYALGGAAPAQMAQRKQPFAGTSLEERTVTIKVLVKHATAKALLCEVEGIDQDEWIPLSQVRTKPVPELDYEGELEITRWLAKRIGLVE